MKTTLQTLFSGWTFPSWHTKNSMVLWFGSWRCVGRFHIRNPMCFVSTKTFIFCSDDDKFRTKFHLWFFIRVVKRNGGMENWVCCFSRTRSVYIYLLVRHFFFRIYPYGSGSEQYFGKYRVSHETADGKFRLSSSIICCLSCLIPKTIIKILYRSHSIVKFFSK